MEQGNPKGHKRKISSSEESEGSNNEIICIEEDSESEPEFTCELWDEDCKISKIKTLKTVAGHHLMPTCSRDPDQPPLKKIKIVPELRQDLSQTNFKQHWLKDERFNEKGLEIITNPFKVCIISNFLENPQFLTDIRQEFNEIQWNTRSMDLYEFFQSKDLKELQDHKSIKLFYEFLQSTVMKWVADFTGYDLTHVSATCSLYSNTDYLLVHDDQREDRKVAFVLYLTEEWSEDNGGALQLLAKDSTRQPSEIVRDIYPANNQLVFFPVTNDSYHQVAEVTSLNHCRLSINGWFHTKTPPVFQTPHYKPTGIYGDQQLKSIDFDVDLSCWLTEDYLNCKIMKEIQEYFEENSEISLKNFLKKECLSEIGQMLGGDLKWRQVGPPNRHCYQVVHEKDCPDILKRLINLFRSRKMFQLLERYTDLELTKDSARMKFELQKWTPGSYSLLTDYDWSKKELDLILHFGCDRKEDVIGGNTLYVTVEDEVQDALITLEPEQNNLNIVYRDSARFTKYFSKQSKCRCFYTLICCYSET